MSKHTFRTTTRVWDKEAGDHVTISLDIVIDVDRVARSMGHKAHANKTGKSTAMHSAIVAKIIPKT